MFSLIDLPKNVVTWTNLGLLYLHHNDLELANQALFRAQTLDPDYALAWIGQALVATANEHDIDAKTLLEHAVSLTASVASLPCVGNSDRNLHPLLA